MKDEEYISGECWQYRSSIDRRFWQTSGGWPDSISFGVVDDYGNIARSYIRPLGL